MSNNDNVEQRGRGRNMLSSSSSHHHDASSATTSFQPSSSSAVPTSIIIPQGNQQDSSNQEFMFEITLTDFDVRKGANYFIIPSHHAEKHFPPPGAPLLFEDESGKLLQFRYTYWPDCYTYVFTSGIFNYLRDNNLKANDVVQFLRHKFVLKRFYIRYRRHGGQNNNNPTNSHQNQNYRRNNDDEEEEEKRRPKRKRRYTSRRVDHLYGQESNNPNYSSTFVSSQPPSLQQLLYPPFDYQNLGSSSVFNQNYLGTPSNDPTPTPASTLVGHQSSSRPNFGNYYNSTSAQQRRRLGSVLPQPLHQELPNWNIDQQGLPTPSGVGQQGYSRPMIESYYESVSAQYGLGSMPQPLHHGLPNWNIGEPGLPTTWVGHQRSSRPMIGNYYDLASAQQTLGSMPQPQHHGLPNWNVGQPSLLPTTWVGQQDSSRPMIGNYYDSVSAQQRLRSMPQQLHQGLPNWIGQQGLPTTWVGQQPSSRPMIGSYYDSVSAQQDSTNNNDENQQQGQGK